MSEHTEGPWDYVPSTEHHGPYVTSEFGTTVCDCYVMSKPDSLSVRNGGESKPIHHLGEMADANARLIASAPDMLEALRDIAKQWPDSSAAKTARAAIAQAEGRS